jgi:hypothetical protein
MGYLTLALEPRGKAPFQLFFFLHNEILGSTLPEEKLVSLELRLPENTRTGTMGKERQ